MLDANQENESSIRRKFPRMFFLFLLVVLFGGIVFGLIKILGKKQEYIFVPKQSAVINPLMGWAPWANSEVILQPHSLVYADLTWRDFEPQEGVYDFVGFEDKYRLSDWRVKGVRVVFRFVMDVPRDEEHLDIPDWLYEKTAGNGDHYSDDHRKGYTPDYSDPILIRAHQQAIQALGNRYGQDDFFAYVELGSLGHWGEWHVTTSRGIRPLPVEEIRDQYVMHYVDAFPNTHLLMRRPFKITNTMGMGLYNDMTGDPEATQTWIDWIKNGGVYSQTGEIGALVPMPLGWQVAPVGGEQTGSLSEEAIYLTHLDRTLQLLRESHTTFIGPGGPYDLPPDNLLQDGMDQVITTIGYRLYVSHLQLPERINFGRVVNGSVTFANAGIAPMYYHWPVTFYLLDEKGKERISICQGSTVGGLLPKQSKLIEFSIPIQHLEDGIYTLGVGISDPLTGKPAVHLVMENPREDLIQPLGSFEIKRLLSSLFDW